MYIGQGLLLVYKSILGVEQHMSTVNIRCLVPTGMVVCSELLVPLFEECLTIRDYMTEGHPQSRALLWIPVGKTSSISA